MADGVGGCGGGGGGAVAVHVNAQPFDALVASLLFVDRLVQPRAFGRPSLQMELSAAAMD